MTDRPPRKPNIHSGSLEDDLDKAADEAPVDGTPLPWVGEHLAVATLGASVSPGIGESAGEDESWIAVVMAWPSLSEANKDILARMAAALAVARAKERKR